MSSLDEGNVVLRVEVNWMQLWEISLRISIPFAERDCLEISTVFFNISDNFLLLVYIFNFLFAEWNGVEFSKRIAFVLTLKNVALLLFKPNRSFKDLDSFFFIFFWKLFSNIFLKFENNWRWIDTHLSKKFEWPSVFEFVLLKYKTRNFNSMLVSFHVFFFKEKQ